MIFCSFLVIFFKKILQNKDSIKKTFCSYNFSFFYIYRVLFQECDGYMMLLFHAISYFPTWELWFINLHWSSGGALY